MTIYVDDGAAVKIYPVKVKVAKAIMTLLEMDDELVCSETHAGYGVAIVDKAESEEEVKSSMDAEVEGLIDAELKGLIDAEYSNCQ